MGEVRHLDSQTKVVIRNRKDRGLGPEIRLSFRRKVWWFIWKEIYPHHYTIYLRYFWGCNPKRGGRSMGEMDYVIKDTFAYGHHCETWVPEYFNLDLRIEEIYQEIKTNRERNQKIWELIQ
jgi:hypothetical protein